ncbi:anthranilate synthase component I family protein [Kozakia baliensis]|uniref:anthranilate synthase component I family protein n=1 Tax=Kozakia baliensis TaxID=153496 RepID=UPI00345BF103
MLQTELPWRSPDAFLAAWAHEPWLVLLDSGGPLSERTRWTILCRRPSQTLVNHGESDPWPQLRAMLPPTTSPSDLPFTGGIIGLASYEAGMRLEHIASRHRSDEPLLIGARYDGVLLFDRQGKRLFWASHNDTPPPDDLPACTIKPAPLPHLHFTSDLDASAWQEAVRQTIVRIAEGEIFQANLTARWTAPRPEGLSPVDLYRHLRKSSPAPFGGLFASPGFALLSASVERFLSMNPQGRIETRPIKGTAPLGANAEENAAIAARLATNEKEYAENLMITDLMRNDIGRICEIGSVTVPELCAVERFAHLHHLVSSVRGQLRAGLNGIDLLQATLPPGSVTGAPKHQAMRLIDELEGSARGVYCGSLFRLGVDGALDSNVIIRSLSLTDTILRLGAGGGITYLSNPKQEYAEMRLKAAALLNLFAAS